MVLPKKYQLPYSKQYKTVAYKETTTKKPFCIVKAEVKQEWIDRDPDTWKNRQTVFILAEYNFWASIHSNYGIEEIVNNRHFHLVRGQFSSREYKPSKAEKSAIIKTVVELLETTTGA